MCICFFFPLCLYIRVLLHVISNFTSRCACVHAPFVCMLCPVVFVFVFVFFCIVSVRIHLHQLSRKEPQAVLLAAVRELDEHPGRY